MEKIKATKTGKPHKLTSRKFWLSQEILILSLIVPIVFKGLEITDSLTLGVLGIITAIGGLYGVLNLMDKKNGGEG